MSIDLPQRVPLSCIELLRDALVRNPDAEALVFIGGPRLTYAQLAGSVAAFAARLRSVGASGGRVAIFVPTGADMVISLLASMAAGAQAMLMNPDYSAREVALLVEDATPVVIVCGPQQLPMVRAAALGVPTPPTVLPMADGGTTLIADCADVRVWNDPLPDPDGLALLQFTGGTTGKPKGVVLTHRLLGLNIAQREALLPTREGIERTLCMTPLFHGYGLNMAFYTALYSAGAMVVLPKYRKASALAAISEERITLFAGVPTIFNGLVAHAEFAQTDFSSLHAAFSGAAPLSVEVMQLWEERTGVPIYEGYGLTEATSVLTFNPMNGARKPGSVGLPMPMTTLEVVDVETGTVLQDVGVVGEVRVKGPQMMVGYRNLPEATSAILRDGWLYTGDIGELDRDGYLFLRNRKTDMALVGGFNVYPREIEDVIYAHPAVEEVVVTGVPDAYRGEAIAALVTLKSGFEIDEEALVAYCKERLVH